MILGYVYLLICGIIGLIYSIIGPNMLMYSPISKFLKFIQPYYNFFSIFNLYYFGVLLSIGSLIGIMGYFLKSKKIKRNLFLVLAFILFGILLIHFGIIIGSFNESNFYFPKF